MKFLKSPGMQIYLTDPKINVSLRPDLHGLKTDGKDIEQLSNLDRHMEVMELTGSFYKLRFLL